MSDLHNLDERTAVDVAGCEKNSINRPARLYYGSEDVELKIPEGPYSFYRTDYTVDLGEWR